MQLTELEALLAQAQKLEQTKKELIAESNQATELARVELEKKASEVSAKLSSVGHELEIELKPLEKRLNTEIKDKLKVRINELRKQIKQAKKQITPEQIQSTL